MKPINPNEPKIKCPHCGVTEMPPGWSDASLVEDLLDLKALRDEGVIICDACANKP